MLAAIASLFLRHRSPVLQLAHRAAVLVTLAVAIGTTSACSKESTSPAGNKLTYGPSLALGQGIARSFVTTDAAGTPKTLGIALSEAAMTGLPQHPMPGMPSAAMLILQLPVAAANTGFDHVMLDWNPAGHEPEHVYTLPHFDFHFYTATEAEQMAIMPNAPDFEQRASRVPDAQFAPAGYVAAHLLMKAPAPTATIPMMGLHWIDSAAAELHGQKFASTFIWGSFDGRFIFLEPMITKAHIESAKTVAGNAIVTALKTPVQYQRAGYYPDRYTVRWDASAKEYQISMDGLKPQR